LTEELLDEAVEHVPEEVHFGAAWDGTVMVVIDGELCVDCGGDVGLVEVGEDVGKNEGAIG
jgi:hypothetical protein